MESALEVRQMNLLYALTIYLIQIQTRPASANEGLQMSVGWRAGLTKVGQGCMRQGVPTHIPMLPRHSNLDLMLIQCAAIIFI